jgi:hypothetical protein
MRGSGKLKHATITFFLVSMFLFSGAQSLKDHVIKGDRYFARKDYSNALENYKQALQVDATDPRIHYKTGISYLNQENYSLAVTHLAAAYELKPDLEPDMDYHLATAYQQDHQYAKAKLHFESFRSRNKQLSPVINEKIKVCIEGDSLMKLPAIGRPEALGTEINTPFMELSPMITPDGDLIFTSNRTSQEYQAKRGSNGEDVYISAWSGSGWSAPAKISNNINVQLNDAAVFLSPDGKTLFLNYEEGGGDLYTSTLANGEWTRPVPLNNFVNHPQYRESGACLSPDGQLLFFSSNRPGGKGGFDLYVSAMGPNGQWGRAANLGSTINTRRDEEFPFLHRDGMTLYFSSDGHATFGSHDIFRSTLLDGKWAPPENLGYPMNTSGYEASYFVAADNKTAYFSSRRGAAGSNLDIYSIDLAATIH